MADNKEMVDALKAAIEMEEEGRTFYLDSAKKTKNDFGKRVFEALADDETRHIVAIRSYCHSMTQKDKAPRLCAVMPAHKNIKERLVFGKKEMEILKNMPEDADGLKAYEVAMDMENKGYAFYKEQLERSQDPDVKELYKFLISEEETHFELIDSTYKYLKDPASWFAEDEKPIVEGG